MSEFVQEEGSQFPTTLSADLDVLVSEMKAQFQDDNILKAIEMLKEIERLIEEEGDDSINKKYQEMLQNDEEFCIIKRSEKEIGLLLDKVNDTESWIPVYSSNDVRTFTRDSGDDGDIEFRVEGICRADLFSCLASIYEIDLFPEWLPQCQVGELVKTVSRFRLILHLLFPLIWPLAPRDIFAVGYGDVDLNHQDGKRVVIFVKSLSDMLMGEEEVGVGNGNVLMEIEGGFVFKPIQLEPTNEENPDTPQTEQQEQQLTHVTVIFRANPHVDFVPQSLVNYILKNFCGYVIPMLGKHSHRFDSGGDLHERINLNPTVYQELKRRLEQDTEEIVIEEEEEGKSETLEETG